MSRDVEITFEGELSQLKGSLDSMQNEIRGWGQTVSSIGVAAFASWGATKVFDGLKSALSEVASFARETVAAAADVAQVDAKLESVLNANGNAAGFAADELKDYAAALQEVTTFDDEAIKGAETLLATFNKIKGEEFQRATKLALDMATVMGGDAASAAGELGRALNNPERGLMLLERQGVAFTESQKQTIQSLLTLGDVSAAQSILLDELAKKYGGAAEAAANAAGGAFKQFKNMIGDVQESLGGLLLPKLDEAARILKDKLQPVLNDVISDFGTWSGSLSTGDINDFADAVASLTKEFGSLAASLGSNVLPLFKILFDQIEDLLHQIPNPIGQASTQQKWVDSLTEKQFANLQKAVSEGSNTWTFGGTQDAFTSRGIQGPINADEFADIRAAAQARQDRINSGITGAHKVSDAAGGEMEQLRRSLDAIVNFGAQGKLTRDDTTKQQPVDPNVKLFTDAFPKITADLKGLTDFGKQLGGKSSAALGEASALAETVANPLKKAFGAVVDPMKEYLSGEKQDKSFRSGFEDLAGLFRRIQSSAASTENQREEKKLQAAEKTAIASDKSAVANERMAATIEQLNRNLSNNLPAVLG